MLGFVTATLGWPRAVGAVFPEVRDQSQSRGSSHEIVRVLTFNDGGRGRPADERRAPTWAMALALAELEEARHEKRRPQCRAERDSDAEPQDDGGSRLRRDRYLRGSPRARRRPIDVRGTARGVVTAVAFSRPRRAELPSPTRWD